MEKNDSALATIVSVYPRRLVETKIGLFPSEYIIPAGSLDSPGLLIIGDNVHYLVNPDPLSDGKDVTLIKVPVKAMDAAQAIIMDYVNALLSVETGSQPGIFPVKGGYDDPAIVKMQFKKELTIYNEMQIKWFQSLVLMADEMWAKTRSPAGISDMQREACKQLRLERDWMITTTNAEMTKCPFCMSLIIPGAVFCASCRHVLDKKRYEALNPQLVG